LAPRALAHGLNLRDQNDADEFLVLLLDALQAELGRRVAPASVDIWVDDDIDETDRGLARLDAQLDVAWCAAHAPCYWPRGVWLLAGQLAHCTRCAACGKVTHQAEETWGALQLTAPPPPPSPASGRSSQVEAALDAAFGPATDLEVGPCCRGSPATRSTRLWRAPVLLLLHLTTPPPARAPDRWRSYSSYDGGDGDGDGGGAAAAPLRLELARWAYPGGPATSATYRLVGAVLRAGATAGSGHFVTVARDPTGSAPEAAGFCFDDDGVTPAQLTDSARRHGASVYIVAYEQEL
jgi:hypothetical protein